MPTFFIVDLLKPESFDAELFDKCCMALDQTGPKFVVQDDKMYVFNSHVFHADFRAGLRSGHIQCAGRVKIERDGVVGESRHASKRLISDYSFGLAESKKLTREASEEYKHTVLAEKLGDYFEIK